MRSRRSYLAALGSVGFLGLSGCQGSGGDQVTTTTTTTTSTTTTEDTTTQTATPEPQPTYVAFTPTVDESLRSQIPEHHVKELEAMGYDFSKPVAESIAYTDPNAMFDGDVDVVEIGIDPLGMRALHHNDYNQIRTHPKYEPEAALTVHAALGTLDQFEMPEQHEGRRQEAINAAQKAINEPRAEGYPNSEGLEGGSYDREEALASSTLDELLDWTLPLYHNIEDQGGDFSDRSASSTEDLKLMAILEEIADQGTEINSHIFPIKIGGGGHGFGIAYDWNEDILYGIETVDENQVVPDMHQPIEQIKYQEDGWNEPWQDGDTSADLPIIEDKQAFRRGIMPRIVSTRVASQEYYIEPWETMKNDKMNTVAMTDDYLEQIKYAVGHYNKDRTMDFVDIYEASMQLVTGMMNDGNFVYDLTQDGQPFVRKVNSEGTLEKVRDGKVQDITNLPIGA